MPECDVCGNEYPNTMTIEIGVGADATVGIYDSFECAINALAPRCAHCECRIIGHGMECDGVRFCCAHCARQMGVDGVADRAETTNGTFWAPMSSTGGE